MQDIYNILIQNGISPTWVDEEAKMRFSQWLGDVKANHTTAFAEFLTQTKQQVDTLTKELDRISATCREMITNATTAVDSALIALADDSALLPAHLQMLERWIPLHDAYPSLLTALTTIEEKNNKTLCSQPFIMEMTMRRIALQMTATEPLLLSEYHQFTEEPLSGEVIAQTIDSLRALVVELEELFSRGINNASNVITAINKDLTAPTEYTNLLHRLMVELHDIEQKIEARCHYVKISDVL